MKHFEDLRLLKFVIYVLLQLNKRESAAAIKSLQNTLFYFLLPERKQTHNLHGGG
jgi:hypothetical protein